MCPLENFLERKKPMQKEPSKKRKAVEMEEDAGWVLEQAGEQSFDNTGEA